MSEPKISQAAIAAAEGCCHYCFTRFPCDTPPHPMFDRPWFAEKVQQAIDAECKRLRAVNAELLAACKVAQGKVIGFGMKSKVIDDAIAHAESHS